MKINGIVGLHDMTIYSAFKCHTNGNVIYVHVYKTPTKVFYSILLAFRFVSEDFCKILYSVRLFMNRLVLSWLRHDTYVPKITCMLFTLHSVTTLCNVKIHCVVFYLKEFEFLGSLTVTYYLVICVK